MSEDNAFLAAARSTPPDDAARLVYAEGQLCEELVKQLERYM